MKIAIVHDELVQWGGAERLVLSMHEIWPEAPIYTSIYDPSINLRASKRFANCDIRTSFMQKLPFKESLRRQYFPLYPLAFESFDFSEYDIVLSSSTRFAHGVITKPRTLHICYSNAPTRFLWESENYLQRENIGSIGQLLLSPFLSYFRIWDQTAVTRPDFWIANSKNVAEKLKKYYRKDAEIIFPGVDIGRFATKVQKLGDQGYFLVVTRLLPWKRVDLAVLVCSDLKLPLIVVGDGPAFKKLKSIAGPTIQFLGNVSEDKLVSLTLGARALIMTQEEDFGLTAIEAQAAGAPVIAYTKGGARETVLNDKTGIFFESQEKGSLKKAITKFNKMRFDREDCIKQAQKFSDENFRRSLRDFVNQKWQVHQKTI